MNSNEIDVTIEVGRLRPAEVALQHAIFDAIVEAGNGKVTVTETVGVLEEIKLMMQGVLAYPEGYE